MKCPGPAEVFWYGCYLPVAELKLWGTLTTKILECRMGFIPCGQVWGLPYMTSIQRGVKNDLKFADERYIKFRQRGGEGVKESNNFAYVIYGSPPGNKKDANTAI